MCGADTTCINKTKQLYGKLADTRVTFSGFVGMGNGMADDNRVVSVIASELLPARIQ